MFNVVFFGSNGKALASKIDVSSLLVGDGLYYGSNQLSSKTFTNELASLISGYYTFAVSNLKTFTGSLTSLQNGTGMFSSCHEFTTFNSSLDNLFNGSLMFDTCRKLASFTSSLNNLRNGEKMFFNGQSLPSFSVSLPKLTNGSRMFDGCSSLETFNSVLPSLENGSYMFQGCKLSGRSVRNIVESLPTHETQHSITIGINCTEDIEGQQEFLRETGYNTFEEIEDALAAKGWKVVWHFQGFPSGWRPVEYLEGTGTQYIDTGIKLSNESEVQCVFFIEPGTANGKLFGADNNGKCPMFRLYGPLDGNTFFYAGGEDSQRWYIGLGALENKIYSFQATDRRVVLNGTSYVNHFPESSWETLYSAAIFGCSITETIKQIHPGARVYSFSISRAGTPQCDLIPCVDKDGNPCMYDRVTKTSLYNAGSGKFLVPSTSVTFSLRQPQPEFAQITPTGVRKLYHLPYDYEGTLEEYVEAEGYKPLIENKQPEEGSWMPEWTETEDAVALTWVEAPEEIVEI